MTTDDARQLADRLAEVGWVTPATVLREQADEIDRLRTLTDALREFCEDDGEGEGYPSPIDHKYEALLAALRALTEQEDQ